MSDSGVIGAQSAPGLTIQSGVPAPHRLESTFWRAALKSHLLELIVPVHEGGLFDVEEENICDLGLSSDPPTLVTSVTAAVGPPMLLDHRA